MQCEFIPCINLVYYIFIFITIGLELVNDTLPIYHLISQNTPASLPRKEQSNHPHSTALRRLTRGLSVGENASSS
jgi:hypothetical protein